MSTQRNGCAGRPSDEECPDDSFCFFPPAAKTVAPAKVAIEADPSDAAPDTVDTRMTKAKLEQCATILTSFNGPSFAFSVANGGLPDDSHIEAGQTKLITKHALAHGSRMAKNVQQILKTLWPYPVCSAENEGSNCTSFPLPVPSRDNDGGLKAGKCLQYTTSGAQVEVDCSSLDSPIDMSFLSADSSNGVIDYHCTWAMLHTLSFNGGAVLTAVEKRAFGELLMYISGQFDCKVCRNNFVNIIKHFGMPKGNIREDYARWLWQAHNNANEHSYATHSKDLTQVKAAQQLQQPDSNSVDVVDPFTLTRTDEWENPTHEHAWYMTFEDAMEVWTNLEGQKSQY